MEQSSVLQIFILDLVRLHTVLMFRRPANQMGSDFDSESLDAEKPSAISTLVSSMTQYCTKICLEIHMIPRPRYAT